MSHWKVPLADVVATQADIDAVVDAYRSGWWTMGPRTESFEAAFAAYSGAGHAIAVTNGTAALHLICAGTGLGPGDEVVAPSLTFVATVNAIAYTGARPVFADVAGPTEPWLSARSVEAALTPRTKAVMAMSYGGHPGEIEELREFCAGRGLILLEDAAHGAGSRLGGRHLGTFGRAGAFSFFSNKNLGIGEGGMVVTRDGDLAARLRLLRSHGMTALTWDRHRGHASEYDVVELGFNYRIDEARAALAEERLSRLDQENGSRARLDERYRAALADVPRVEPALPPRSDSVLAHHLFTVVLDAAVDRDRVRAALAERGVQTSVHYPPVHRFSTYASPAYDLPVTDLYASRAVTLPMFAHMTEAQQDLVVEALSAATASATAVPAGDNGGMPAWRPMQAEEALRLRPLRVLARPWTERRFVHRDYERVLHELSDSRRFNVVPLREFREASTDRVVVGMRHDVDERLGAALELARLEARHGIRATYFVLHTARYYAKAGWGSAERRPSILGHLRELQDMGHEIGWHNDLVTLQCVHGIEPREYLANELEWLRSNGIDIRGTASHGSYWARRLGYHNNYFFDDFEEVAPGLPNRDIVEVGNRECVLSKGRLADFGFEYEAYHLGEDHYFSDARFDADGRRWHPDSLDFDAFNPGDKVILLTHPDHWDRSVGWKAPRTVVWAGWRAFTGERSRRPG